VEQATVRFDAKILGLDPAHPPAAVPMHPGAAGGARPLRDGVLEVAMPARGLEVWRLPGVKTDVAAHRAFAPPSAGAHAGHVAVKADRLGIEARGAAIQVAPGPWDAFLWCTASPEQAQRVTFHHRIGGQWREWTDTEYPFEFSLPVASAGDSCQFFIVGRTRDGAEFRTAEVTLGAYGDAPVTAP
jgi:hypothetical protein